VLDEALDIAMDYLEYTGQADAYSETRWHAARAILHAWEAGTEHKIRLANCGIVAIEKGSTLKQGNLPSLFPRVG
jgi:hypothetical protein